MRSHRRAFRSSHTLLALLVPLVLVGCGDADFTAPDASSLISPAGSPTATARSADLDTAFAIPSIGGVFDLATDVNDGGVVVGWGIAASPSRINYAFAWSPDRGTEDLAPATLHARAEGIAANSTVAGFVIQRIGFPTDPVLWPGLGDFQVLSSIVRDITIARDVGDGGDVVGEGTTPETRALLWPGGGGPQILPTPDDRNAVALGINAAGDIVGHTLGGGLGFRGFLIRNGSFVQLDPLSGADFSDAAAVNGDRLVAGTSTASGRFGDFRPVVWEDGGPPTSLPLLAGGEEGEAFDVNERGWVAGYSEVASGERRPVIWKREQGSWTITVLDSAGFATAISDEGWVAGSKDGQAFAWKLKVDACRFFVETPSDPLLADDSVQVAMARLWEDSNPDAPDIRDQVEMGGYIVERDGQLQVVPFGSNQSPRMCSSTFDRREIPGDATLRGFFHTHPHAAGARVPPDGSCGGRTTGKFSSGPSDEDLLEARASNVPSYVVEKDSVHRIPARFSSGDPIAAFRRNPEPDCP